MITILYFVDLIPPFMGTHVMQFSGIIELVKVSFNCVFLCCVFDYFHFNLIHLFISITQYVLVDYNCLFIKAIEREYGVVYMVIIMGFNCNA